ncbi:MAG: 6-carboxytetrahydropterin synthase [Gammaproteobacteria bacterium]|nr:6-carboxytetrahydropterin synthase [Gammaproteobacteria bacterium]
MDCLDNRHLLRCCGLTLQEYALRHQLPLDVVVHGDLLGHPDPIAGYSPPLRHLSETARAVLRAVNWAGLLQRDDGFVLLPGEVKRLDLLFWDLQWLREYGFKFRQEYRYSESSHRVVARNLLKAPAIHLEPSLESRLSPVPPPDFVFCLAVIVAHIGELQAGYLFMQFSRRSDGQTLALELARRGIEVEELDAADHPQGILLRTATRPDTQRLMALIDSYLKEMPGALERFQQQTPEVTVSKELVFDSAHFITDHPAKCANLHGGRYLLHVKVRGRIDPVTGCVVDYGYLKRVANRQIVERFDHHNLNYAASELSWRSSTEMLCVYIWERLIGYLPGLVELELYETPQSWCTYRGPDLERFQASGSDSLLTHFTDKSLGRSPLRSLVTETPAMLREVVKA